MSRTDTKLRRVPELPEVETTRSRLAPLVAGRRIVTAEILDPLLTRPAPPEALASALSGDRILDVRRRGKYLVFGLESGRHLLVHLGMTGSVQHHADGRPPADAHRRATLTLDDEAEMTYRDVRRFGRWLLLEPGELEGHWRGRLGREPLERGFTARELARALAGRKAPVKAALLDQRAVAGIGNIYADEALWRARVHPRRSAGSLGNEELRALRKGIAEALRVGLARHGATLRDYRGADGARGRMQTELRVYGREGEPCLRCGTPIEKTRTAGRGTWYCPACQRLPD